MGIEYKIKFEVKNKEKIEEVLNRINTAYNKNVSVSLEDDGIYFCDFMVDDAVAYKVFRMLISEGLGQSSEIMIYEP